MSSQAPRLGVIETEGAGPPVVLLHGFGGCAAGWEAVQRGLGRAALAFDLPGHAGSLAHPGFGSASFAAKAVISEMDQRGIEAFHLAGHSMGGAVAALIACRMPRRALSMTLLAPGGFGSEINAALLRSFGNASTPEELRACLEIMFAPTAHVPDPLIAMLAEQRAVQGQAEALAHVASKILNGDAQGVLDHGQLAALSMPVSLLWGGQDRMMAADQILQAPGHFHKQVLPDAGHMLADEAQEEVSKAIIFTSARAARSRR
jgi:pimeloyl-ACP methyl ester carboxylesterase